MLVLAPVTAWRGPSDSATQHIEVDADSDDSLMGARHKGVVAAVTEAARRNTAEWDDPALSCVCRARATESEPAVLCLYKNPSDTYAFIDLGTVIRYIVPTFPVQRIYYWQGAVKSLWAGVDAGNLATCDTTIMACYSYGPYVAFGPSQKVDNVPSGTVIGGTLLGPNTVFLEN